MHVRDFGPSRVAHSSDKSAKSNEAREGITDISVFETAGRGDCAFSERTRTEFASVENVVILCSRVSPAGGGLTLRRRLLERFEGGFDKFRDESGSLAIRSSVHPRRLYSGGGPLAREVQR